MVQIKCMQEHQKTATCQKKGLLFDKTLKQHYYENNDKQEAQKQALWKGKLSTLRHIC